MTGLRKGTSLRLVGGNGDAQLEVHVDLHLPCELEAVPYAVRQSGAPRESRASGDAHEDLHAIRARTNEPVRVLEDRLRLREAVIAHEYEGGLCEQCVTFYDQWLCLKGTKGVAVDALLLSPGLERLTSSTNSVQ